MVFQFLWGGKYEYIRRDIMYRPINEGGRDVPHIPLKLDCLFFTNLCTALVGDISHKFQFFVKFWLSFPMRHLIPISNSVPKAETRPAWYEHVVVWSKANPACKEKDSCLSHRMLYGQSLSGFYDRFFSVAPQKAWEQIQPKSLDNKLCDFNWLCAHRRVPVREVLHRHSLTRNPFCPRSSCMTEETQKHMLWECSFSEKVWERAGVWFNLLVPSFVCNYDIVMYGLGVGKYPKNICFLLWFLISSIKFEIWGNRNSLVKNNNSMCPDSLIRGIRFKIKRHIQLEVDRWGFHAAKEKWKHLIDL